jgi:hypothetical protein
VFRKARLVVCRHDVHATALDPVDQSQEGFAALQLAAADVEVAVDIDLPAGRHRGQGVALLLLDLG